MKALRWEHIDTARADKARVWFFRWRDKDFSFTDCTSFVVMRELRLRRALTTDRHFRDAGFEIVPSSLCRQRLADRPQNAPCAPR